MTGILVKKGRHKDIREHYTHVEYYIQRCKRSIWCEDRGRGRIDEFANKGLPATTRSKEETSKDLRLELLKRTWCVDTLILDI